MKTRIFLLIIFFLFSFFSCKKKTTIKARVYNYAMGEAVAGATVDLVEKKEVGSLSGSSSKCEVLATAITDANGYCVFDGAKLKTGSKFEYYLGLSKAYGDIQTYPCGGKTSGFINVGESNEQVLNASYFDGFLKVEYDNLLSPSQNGDSLTLRILSAEYSIPGEPYPSGGGGVLVSFPYYGGSGFPYPSVYYLNPVKTQCGYKVVNIRKRKLGVVTTSIDTILVRPNQETLLQVQW